MLTKTFHVNVNLPRDDLVYIDEIKEETEVKFKFCRE